MPEKALRVLFLSSEVAPFSKTGGLADISAALPRALSRLQCDVRVLTPRYGFVDREHHGIELLNGANGLQAGFRGQSLRFGFSRKHEDGGPDVYFVECDPLYDRPGVYVDPFTNRDYIDNDYRFILLCRAATALCRETAWNPHIVHGNDWQSALAAYYVGRARGQGEMMNTRTLLTIHNIAFHGLFGPESLSRIGEDAASFFHPGGPLEFYGQVSFLKAGLQFADALNTVSPTYAREIQSSYEFGYGLETVLRARGEIAGILNGIDTDVWNPAADRFIPAPYDVASLERKERNKEALCAKLGLAFDPAAPLFGCVSRLAYQKGFEILLPAVPDILSLPSRMVMLGSGDPRIEHVLHEFARAFPDRFAVQIGYDEGLSHLIEAGADIFLMPSKYEPCGLNQMMSMRYGTLPVVRATGGLADTVTDADADPVHGTGFSFTDYTPDALLAAVQRAVHAFRDRRRWSALQKNAMTRDFSWSSSAHRYRELYERALQNPPRVVT